MKWFFLIGFYTSISLAESGPLFTTITIEERSGEKFRMEMANNFPRCQVYHRARKIYQHDKNELREIGLFRNGKWEVGGANNKPALRRDVDAIFAQSQISGNPCEKPAEMAKPIEKPVDTMIEIGSEAEAPVEVTPEPVPQAEPKAPVPKVKLE